MLAMSLNQHATEKLPLRKGVVAVVVREDRYLVICRSQLVRAPGAFCFPGGHIEPGETDEQALVREFQEELGAPIEPIRELWRNTTRWQIELAWWLGTISPDQDLVPNAAEVAEYHWLTGDEMRRLPKLLESNREFLDAVAGQTVRLD